MPLIKLVFFVKFTLNMINRLYIDWLCSIYPTHNSGLSGEDLGEGDGGEEGEEGEEGEGRTREGGEKV